MILKRYIYLYVIYMNILTESDIYFKTLIKHDLKLRPCDLNENFEQNLEKILKNKFEGRCIKEGYVRPNSIKLLERSIGNMDSNQFTGNIEFEIVYGAEVCNIPKGCVVKAVVKDVNKMGILAELGPLVIIVPKDLHDNKELFKEVSVGNSIFIFVIGKTYNLNNRRIQVYGKLHTTEINKTITIKKKNKNNKKFKDEQNIFEDEDIEEDEEIMDEETELEKFEEGEGSDFDQEDTDEEEEEMQEPVVEDTTEYQEELEEEGFPNELNEEIVDDVTSEQDDTELDEEITLD